MDYKIELAKLYNSLLTIETKGQHTMTMANCLRFLEQLINYEESKQEEPKQEEPKQEKHKKEVNNKK